MNSQNKSGTTALQIACRSGNLGMAMMLIFRGCDINLRDHVLDSPLSIALGHRNEDIALALIERDAEVNVLNRNLENPLHIACRNNCGLAALHLIMRGVDINATDHVSLQFRGTTAHHCWSILKLFFFSTILVIFYILNSSLFHLLYSRLCFFCDVFSPTRRTTTLHFIWHCSTDIKMLLTRWWSMELTTTYQTEWVLLRIYHANSSTEQCL